MSTTNVVSPDSQNETTTPKIAANFLGLSTKTLANMRCRGDGPKFVKLGRIRYRWNDLFFYVESRVCASTSDSDRRKWEE